MHTPFLPFSSIFLPSIPLITMGWPRSASGLGLESLGRGGSEADSFASSGSAMTFSGRNFIFFPSSSLTK